MKPHEEEWIVHPLDSRAVVKRDAANAEEDGLVVADIRRPLHEDGREVAALISAAPNMARALLANGYVRNMGDGLWHTLACNDQNDGGASCLGSCTQARVALAKAGVLP